MPTDRSSIVLRASRNWTQEVCYFSPAAIVCWGLFLQREYSGGANYDIASRMGHIIGRLPEDDDSWDGRSIRHLRSVAALQERDSRGCTQQSERQHQSRQFRCLTRQ